MKNRKKIKDMVIIALFAAMVAVLQYLSMFIKFGPFNITLALTPIIVGAILFKEKVGIILGAVMGVVVLATNAEAFFVVNPAATIFTCLIKSSLAGLAAAVVYKLFKNKVAGTIVASIITPIVNTLVFVICCVIFFWPTLTEWAAGEDTLVYLFTVMIGLQFIVELLVNAFISPIVIRIVDMLKHKTEE